MVSSKNDKQLVRDVFAELANIMFEKFMDDPERYINEFQGGGIDLSNINKQPYYKQCCIAL